MNNDLSIKPNPKDTITERLAALSPAKRALLEQRLTKNKGSEATGDQTIPRRANREAAPLSFAQQRLWFLQQLEPENPFYNITGAMRLNGTLNVYALQKALDAIVARHEVLRTTLVSVDGNPKQFIAESRAVELPVIVVENGKNRIEQEAGIQHLIREETQRLFNLSSDLMLRATLLRLEPTEHILILVRHHIASDGWSMGILFRELSALYKAFTTGQPSPLAPLPIQYADFAYWQRQWLTGDVLETQINYWKQQLAGAPALLELPTDHPRPPNQRFQGQTASLQLSPELTEQLKTLSQQASTTLFMTLLAAFAILLSRYSGQSDIVIGSPIANRTHRQIESLIGFFVNTLALRIDLNDNPRFEELLRRVKQVALDAYAHQDIPFEKLVEELQPERNLSHSPLFQVMFVLQNAPRDTIQLSSLNLTPLKYEHMTAKFDLLLSMVETGQGLAGQLEYNTDLFEPATITRMVGHFQTLLEGIVKTPLQPIASLPLLTETESQQLMAWNDTATDYPLDQCIHQLFEAQVEKTPDAVAVVFQAQQLTYRELNNQANQLAHELQTLGVKPEVLVGICIERSIDMLIGLLGIIKAGGAYLPLDPAYPAARLAFMLEDAGVGVLLTQSSLVKELPKTTAQVVCLDTETEKLSGLSTDNLDNGVAPSNLAYLIYTSGSTGKPKGVAMEQSSLINLINWQLQQTTISPNAKTLQFAPFSFDVSFQEMFSTWCSGGTLLLIKEELRRDAKALLAVIREQAIERLFLPFVALQHLADVAANEDTLPRLREIITAGEQLQITPEIANWFQKLSGCTLYNHYGPSESHVVTAFTDLTEVNDWPRLPPIGRPIANTQIYLLDRHQKLTPIGVPGEIHIGGAGLARGYFNRPELTQEKFIPNPFSNEPEARLYKTGDLARYLPDGNIFYLGRIDNQVKIRGFRIELGEIEAVLAQHPAVRENAVIVPEKSSQDKRLVAYLVPNKDQVIETIELRRFLKDRLPDYMMPSAFVQLSAMPLTPNGKIDRRALPAPNTVRTQLENTFVTPRTLTEEMLARIWVDILGIESFQRNSTQINIHDNFFDIGGHSLLAARLIDQVRNVFQVELPLRRLFEFPTIAELAKCIESPAQMLPPQAETKHRSSLVPIQLSGGKRPVFIMPGGGGGEKELIHLAKLVYLLGKEQPVYGLQARGWDGEQNPHPHVEAMATDYIHEIRAVQPDGPYLLVGECISGQVAFEMAQQLQAQGQKVALLVLIDTVYLSRISYLTYLVSKFLKIPEIRYHWKTLSQLEQEERLPYLFEKVRKAMHILFTRIVSHSIPQDQQLKIFRRHQNTLMRYRPKPYPGRLVLLVTEKLYKHNPTLGWDTLAAVEVYKLPGDHSSYLGEHVQATAKQLKACLEEAQEGL